jgi:hypothetical protein
VSELEACQFRAWHPWHAYNPEDPAELTLCGRSIAGAARLWQPWADMTTGRCQRCAKLAERV